MNYSSVRLYLPDHRRRANSLSLSLSLLSCFTLIINLFFFRLTLCMIDAIAVSFFELETGADIGEECRSLSLFRPNLTAQSQNKKFVSKAASFLVSFVA
jgi:hypothetical protein